MSSLDSKTIDLVANKNSEIAKKDQEIANHISDIVASMQSHDITRQKIEHVVIALENLVSSNNMIGNAKDLSDFPADKIEEFKDTLPYPPEGSPEYRGTRS